MPTPKQLQLIHAAARKVGLNEAQYRMLLLNVADVASAKDLSQADYEDVMAVLEDLGFAGTYWRDRVKLRGGVASTRMVFKILRLAEEQSVPVGALCHRLSNGRTDVPGKLYPREAWNVIEALKSIVVREGGTVVNLSGGGSEAERKPA